MKLKEIKQSVEAGNPVYWKNKNYEVIKDSKGQYLIHSLFNNCYWGLTWRDGTTMNGDERDFING